MLSKYTGKLFFLFKAKRSSEIFLSFFVIHPSVCPFVYLSENFIYFLLNFSPEILGSFQLNLTERITREREFKSLKMKGHAVF